MLIYLIARKRLVLALLTISTVVGLVGAKLNAAGVPASAAVTHVMIDYPAPSIVERRALQQHVNTLQKRAEIFGRLMVTTPVLDRIGRRAHVAGDQIAGVARTTASVPIPLLEPGSEVRASQVAASKLPYHLELQSSPSEPILAIYAQAPTADEAERLANAAPRGLQDYLQALAQQEAFPERKLVRIRQLEPARGGVINAKARVMIAALTFIVAFGLTLVVLLALLYGWLRRRDPEILRSRRERPIGPDNWPHTSRVLPWAIAGFIAMLWLLPFNKIQLAMSTPIDMKLDRLVLPLIVFVWLLAFAAGGTVAPRLRMTWIHVALGAFLTCALLSVVLDAGYLNQTLEFELSFKKLPLLVSYLSLFVIVASAVRPGEVRAFMTFTAGLAVITAIGIVWEMRFHQNLFSVWSTKLLPGGFELEVDPSGVSPVDAMGRPGIVGPAEVGARSGDHAGDGAADRAGRTGQRRPAQAADPLRHRRLPPGRGDLRDRSQERFDRARVGRPDARLLPAP